MSEVQNWGSQQWCLMRIALRDGATLEEAAEAGSMSVVEAGYLAEIDEKRGPLPPAAFTLIPTHGAPRVASTTTQEKEASMARGRKARERDDEVQEVAVKDPAAALRTFRQDIRPAQSKAAEFNQEQATGYKHIKKNCGFQITSAKQVFKLMETEEAKEEDWVRGFVALYNEWKGYEALTYNGNDLVDRMQGLADDIDSISNPVDDGDGEMTAGTIGEQVDPFIEASEEEVAAQSGRGRKRKATPSADENLDEPAPGTGAAAIAAMNAVAAADATYAALN